MSNAQILTAEALCGALYRLPFAEFLGENEDAFGWHGYFHIGEAPKDMRVTATRPLGREAVEVKVEWRNYHAEARNPLKGEQTLTIPAYAIATEAQAVTATTDVVVKVLEIYKDVLSEEGVAGKIADLIGTAETTDD